MENTKQQVQPQTEPKGVIGPDGTISFGEEPSLEPSQGSPAVSQQSIQSSPSESVGLYESGNSGTYLKSGDQDSGILEVDLVSFREKGHEQRFLSISINGFDISQNPPVANATKMVLNSEEQFNMLKVFFSNLNWND